MSAPSAGVQEWHAAIRAGLPEEYGLEFIDGLVPLVTMPTDADADTIYRFLKKVLPTLPVSGGRMYAEGIVLEPPRAKPEVKEWPHTEPEIVERYGLRARGAA